MKNIPCFSIFFLNYTNTIYVVYFYILNTPLYSTGYCPFNAPSHSHRLDHSRPKKHQEKRTNYKCCKVPFFNRTSGRVDDWTIARVGERNVEIIIMARAHIWDEILRGNVVETIANRTKKNWGGKKENKKNVSKFHWHKKWPRKQRKPEREKN